jgi:hypothetical protein
MITKITKSVRHVFFKLIGIHLIALALILSHSCGGDSTSSIGAEQTGYISHGYKNYESSDAIAQKEEQRTANDNRGELSSEEKIEYREFVNSYTDLMARLIGSYYLYPPNDSERLYISYEVSSEFFDYQRIIYRTILNSKLIELTYLLEMAENHELSETDISRIESIVYSLVTKNGRECVESLDQICLLISI